MENLFIAVGTFLSVVIGILLSIWKFGPENDSTMAQTIESLSRSLKSLSDDMEQYRKECKDQIEALQEENQKLKQQLNKKINLIRKEVKNGHGS